MYFPFGITKSGLGLFLLPGRCLQRGKALGVGCEGLRLCKSEAEMENTRTWGTVWNKMRNAVCSGPSMKTSTPEETAEKRFSQQRGLQQAQRIPAGNRNDLHDNVPCSSRRTQRNWKPLESTGTFGPALVEKGVALQFLWAEEEGSPHSSITVPHEIRETLLIPLVQSTVFCHIGTILFPTSNFGTGPNTHTHAYTHMPPKVLLFVLFCNLSCSQVSMFSFHLTPCLSCSR